VAPNKLTLCHCAAFSVYSMCAHTAAGDPDHPLSLAGCCPFFGRLCVCVCVCVCVRHATIVCAAEHEKKTNSQNAKSTPNSNSDFAIHSSPAPLPLSCCCCCWCCCCCCCVVASVVELRCTAAFKMVCQSFFHIIDCLLDYKPRH